MISKDYDMWTCAIVKGSTEESPGTFGDSFKTDYNCYICYSSISDNIRLIKDYFLYCCDFNFDDLKFRERPPLDDYNCIRAIMAFYFKGKHLVFEYDSYEYCGQNKMPTRKPEKDTNTYKVWEGILKKERISTPKSAAWMLYSTTGVGKISVKDAKRLVEEKYPEHLYAWDEIMREFRRYGGAHTEKYLRKL